MKIFKKESLEILDLTMLRKKGILKNKPVVETEEYVNISPETAPTQSDDFLSVLAKAQAPSDNPLSFMDSPQQNTETTSSTQKESPETKHLKVKIEDIEYKLDKFLERLEQIESRLEKTET